MFFKQHKQDRYISLKEIQTIIPVSRNTINRWEKVGKFPHRRKIGLGKIAWLESELDKWMDEREKPMAKEPEQLIRGKQQKIKE